MTTIEVLRAARSKLEQGWTQNAMARDSSGTACDPRDPEACAWCIWGAAMATSATAAERLAAYDELLQEVTDGTRFIDQVNDAPWNTKAVILKLFTDAIERLESKEAA